MAGDAPQHAAGGLDALQRGSAPLRALLVQPEAGPHHGGAFTDPGERRSELTTGLARLGMQVSVASLSQAPAVAATDPPDALLLDATSGTDPIAALQALRPSIAPQNTPVLLLISSLTTEQAIKSRSLGVASFIAGADLQVQLVAERICECTGRQLPSPDALLASPDAPGEASAAALGLTGPARELAILSDGELRRLRQRVLKQSLSCDSHEAMETLTARLQRGAFDREAMTELVLEQPALLLNSYAIAHERRLEVAGGPLALVTALDRAGLRQACARIGLQLLRSPAADSGEATERWRIAAHVHARAVGRVAKALAPHASPRLGLPPDTLAAAALLHDIGRLLLLDGDDASTAMFVYDLARNAPLPVSMIEQSALGFSHAQLGEDVCHAHHVPGHIAAACRTHDFSDMQLEPLPDAERNLATFVALCDQIALASGFADVPAAELTAPDPALARLAGDHADDIHQALRPLGQPVSTLPMMLSGCTIGCYSADPQPWNPFVATLAAAGAQIARHATIEDRLAGSSTPLPPIQVEVLDLTAVPLGQAVAAVRPQPNAAPRCPRLVLTARADEPSLRMLGTSPGCHFYPTPIRPRNLAQAVRRLASAQES